MGRAMNAFLPSTAMSYPQQLPVSPVHMLEAVVCCVVPTVPTLPVPLLKCLTFHPPPHPSVSWQGVCGRTRSGHRVCTCTCVCVCAVYQGMNKSQRAWICFPWHGLRLNSRSLHPDIRLSFSPKPQRAGKSTKHWNTNTQMHLPFLSCYLLFSLPPPSLFSLLFCSRVLPVALLVQVKDFSSPSPSLFVPCEWEKERIREEKIKRECLRTQRAAYPSQEVWERGRKKKHIFRGRRRGGQHCALLPDSLCVCACLCACVCVCVQAHVWPREKLNAKAVSLFR